MTAISQAQTAPRTTQKNKGLDCCDAQSGQFLPPSLATGGGPVSGRRSSQSASRLWAMNGFMHRSKWPLVRSPNEPWFPFVLGQDGLPEATGGVTMRRREFTAGLGSTGAWPSGARAQHHSERLCARWIVSCRSSPRELSPRDKPQAGLQVQTLTPFCPTIFDVERVWELSYSKSLSGKIRRDCRVFGA
jgi:hypothetical protein